MDINDIFSKFFEVRDQIHYWHLQTSSYAEHKILNKFYEEWLELADKFIETYQGRYNQLTGDVKINLVNYKANESKNYLTTILQYLQGPCRKILYSQDTDLGAILDEMQILTSQTLFLLNLK